MNMTRFLFFLASQIKILVEQARKKRPRLQAPFWWGKVDSNHRSRRQQIYSLPHLTALEFPHIHLELVDGFEPPTC